MIRAIGQSVLIQAIASAGNFIVAILALRILSIEEFGVYALLFLIATTAGSLCWSATGYVYSLHAPRLKLLARHYSREFNGYSLLVTTVMSAAAVALSAVLIGGDINWPGLAVTALFVLPMIATDNLKVQASADGYHGLIARVEAARQILTLAAIAALSAASLANLKSFVLVQGIIGTAACLAIVLALRYRMSFRRLSWVARRHGAVARYLFPTTIVSFFHASGIQFLAAAQFGSTAIGTLRAAELPYSAVNPLKLATNYFLPRLLADFESAPRPDHRAVVVRAAAAITVSIALMMAMIYLAAVSLLPLVTGKPYDAVLGLIWAAGYAGMFLLTIVNHYLSVIGRADIVFQTSLVGAVAAAAVYLATAFWAGMIATVIAISAASILMAIYGFLKLIENLGAVRQLSGTDSTPTPSLA
jgi:O-antigen/teichoic acid export membrane protein